MSSNSLIHPTAIIDPKADLDSSVTVGPYTVIGPDVTIGPETFIGPHVVINGPTSLGARNKIFQFASVGEAPQDTSYKGELTRLEMGNDNIVREFTTLQRGTLKDKGVTRIGDRNLFMAYVHIAHDCIIHNDIIFVNNASLAGHVEVFDHVTLGAFSVVHQFCRIGPYAFSARMAQIPKDVPPYLLLNGPGTASLTGINQIGLERKGFSQSSLAYLRQAFKIYHNKKYLFTEALEQIAELAEKDAAVQIFYDFIKKSASSERGILR